MDKGQESHQLSHIAGPSPSTQLHPVARMEGPLTQPDHLGQVYRFPSASRAHSCHTEAVGFPRGQAIHHTFRPWHQLMAQPPLARGPLFHLHPVATKTPTTITGGSCPGQCHRVTAACHNLSILRGIRESCGKQEVSVPVGPAALSSHLHRHRLHPELCEPGKQGTHSTVRWCQNPLGVVLLRAQCATAEWPSFFLAMLCLRTPPHLQEKLPMVPGRSTRPSSPLPGASP